MSLPGDATVDELHKRMIKEIDRVLGKYRRENPLAVAAPAAMQALCHLAAVVYRASVANELDDEGSVRLANRLLTFLALGGKAPGEPPAPLTDPDGTPFEPRTDLEVILHLTHKFTAHVVALGIELTTKRAELAVQAGCFFAAHVARTVAGLGYDLRETSGLADELVRVASDASVARATGRPAAPGGTTETIDGAALMTLIHKLECDFLAACEPAAHPAVDPDQLGAAAIHALLNVTGAVATFQRPDPPTVRDAGARALAETLHYVVLHRTGCGTHTDHHADPVPGAGA